MPRQHADSIDPEEVARFERLAEDWWNPLGPMRALHQFNPVRVDYLRRLLTKRGSRPESPASPLLEGLEILDIGCGGGILSEALSRLGADVTAIDPAPANIAAARRHAEKSGLAITYLCTTAEALAEEGKEFDAVLAMEVVEHVRDVRSFVAVAARMVRPRGLLIAATLNRTLKSYAFAIVGAEYVLRWLPKGTHRWESFVTPRELAAALSAAGLHVIDETGIVFNPLSGQWRQSRDMDVNYVMAAER
ncbi:MAG TPA: bifunctional 2-polyprenyl-6-hydroxyphenol methylase/3-demethylubiquinol 3-O-methyltransferase UbiG [Methylovirgula sp.]|nr:bifunctional 2-polyprenyl-6-hydroxyphenol methylase/3-demethylubiquinol 3-O-methyltransferase UbiG [Methylovirgula sp.]